MRVDILGIGGDCSVTRTLGKQLLQLDTVRVPSTCVVQSTESAALSNVHR